MGYIGRAINLALAATLNRSDLADALRPFLAAKARAGVRWVYPRERLPRERLPNFPLPLGGGRGRGRVAPETLQAIREDLGDCTRCKLHAGRTQIVFGVGNPHARLLFVGEGPGQDEDRQGEPFVGKAGQLLTRIIEAIGLTRDDVYIANIVKSRPPGNRNPEPDEIAACLPFLERQIASIAPRLIVGLGNIAVKSLLRTDKGIMRLRGNWQDFKGSAGGKAIPVMPTFHPAYLLRNPSDKRLVWEDMLKVADRYNEELPAEAKRATPKTSIPGDRNSVPEGEDPA